MKKKILFMLVMVSLLFTLTGCGKETTYHEVSFDEFATNKLADNKTVNTNI